MNTRVALYARVSSERQMQTNTIESQIIALKNKIAADNYLLLKEFEFIDDGYSGSVLLRPGLERLRDMAANCLFDKLYVHSPDRLARNYAYQYLLLEELKRSDVEIVFLNGQLGDSPESNLLLQVQGVIAEYERTKIMERSRRGKLHAAKQGRASVLSGAPYGYRYNAKKNSGHVGYEIHEEEARAVRSLFSWVGQERLSINAATNRLTVMKFKTPTEKNARWNRGSVHHILRNPAYKGLAAFGKTKAVPKKLRLRPYKGQPAQAKSYCSSERVLKEQWIFIPVPAIIDTALFDAVQEQLEENKRLKRERMTGARYLLQGMVVCNLCGYGYCGNTASGTRKYNYYSCGGTRVYANRDRACDNQSIHANILEEIVWEEIKTLLNNPSCLEEEYYRRIKALNKKSVIKEQTKLMAEKMKLEKSIGRLIDSYTEGTIEKNEFEPRVKRLKKSFACAVQKLAEFPDNQSRTTELKSLLGNLNEFAETMKQKLESADWATKRPIVTALIKQVEIGNDNVNIIFRVGPFSKQKSPEKILEDCRRRQYR